MAIQKPIAPLSPAQQIGLRDFTTDNPGNWKARLLTLWQIETEGHHPILEGYPGLWALRSTHGAAWVLELEKHEVEDRYRAAAPQERIFLSLCFEDHADGIEVIAGQIEAATIIRGKEHITPGDVEWARKIRHGMLKVALEAKATTFEEGMYHDQVYTSAVSELETPTN
jgi:hypothetical protein